MPKAERPTLWLTISTFEERDAVVHGVFSTKAFADACADAVMTNYPTRSVAVGEWLLNEGWESISDGHLR